MVKSTYLGEKMYFESLEKAADYYGHPEAKEVWQLNDILHAEAEGMESPIIEELDF